MTSFVNFAYGSNMSTRRLRARTPSAEALRCARLAGYRLAWHKVGRDGSGKCDIVATGHANDEVWGVLYRIDLAEKHLLDLAEGLGHGYDYKTVDVLAGRDGVQAGAYCATDIDSSLQPFDWYLALVVDGAEEHGLPQHYRSMLRLVGSRHDPDPARRQASLALLRCPDSPAG